MEVFDRLLPVGTNRPGAAIKPIGIVIHETGNANGADADAHYKYWSTQPAAKSSAHAVLDWKKILRLVPFFEKAYHAGKTANNKFIGLEICRCVPFDKKKFDIEWEEAVGYTAEIFKSVLKINTVTKDNLMSHAEVSRKWKETTHTDPEWYFSQGGKTMDEFRNEVQKKLSVEGTFADALDVLENAGVAFDRGYWEANAVEGGKCEGEYVALLLTRISKRLIN